MPVTMQTFPNQHVADSSQQQGFVTEIDDELWLANWEIQATDDPSPAADPPARFGGVLEQSIQRQTLVDQVITKLPLFASEPMMATQIIRPEGENDWEDRRAIITKLYIEENRKLDDVIAIMHREHRFLATERQYKRKFKKWNLKKNIITSESQAMVRIQERRKELEGKDTIFTWRKRDVPPENIERFVKRHKQSATALNMQTPADITYRTPPHVIVKSPPSVLSPRLVMDTSIPGETPVSFTPASPTAAFLPSAASPFRGEENKAEFGVQFLDFSLDEIDLQTPNMTFFARTPTTAAIAFSPTHLAQSAVPLVEMTDNISHVIQTPMRRRSDTAASGHLRFSYQSLQFDSDYMNIERSTQMRYSHLSGFLDRPSYDIPMSLQRISARSINEGTTISRPGLTQETSIISPMRCKVEHDSEELRPQSLEGMEFFGYGSLEPTDVAKLRKWLGDGQDGILPHSEDASATEISSLGRSTCGEIATSEVHESNSLVASTDIVAEFSLRTSPISLQRPSALHSDATRPATSTKAFHLEYQVPITLPERMTYSSSLTGVYLIDEGKSSNGTDGRKASGLSANQSSTPSMTESDVYTTPMSFVVSSLTPMSEPSSDDYATPTGIAKDGTSEMLISDTDNYSTPLDIPNIDNTRNPVQEPTSEGYSVPTSISEDDASDMSVLGANNYSTPRDIPTVEDVLRPEQESFSEGYDASKTNDVDHPSPVSEADFATPMEISVIRPDPVSDEAFDGEVLPIHVSTFEHSVKLTLWAHVPNEPIEAVEKRLRFAAKVGDLNSVERLLHQGANIDALSNSGMSALHLSAYFGHAKVFALLLRKGARIDKVAGDMEFRLLGRNLWVSSPHLIHMAALRGHQDIIDIICKSIDPSDVSDLESGFDSDLMSLAVENDQVHLAAFVIRSRGYDWFKRYFCHWDENYIASATRNGSLPLVSLFLDNGMSPNTPVDPESDITLLWIAAARGHNPIVNHLLERGAEIHQCDMNGLGPLQAAIIGGHKSTVESLLENGAPADSVCPNLHFAVEAGDVDIVELLLSTMSNPYSRITAVPTLCYLDEDTESLIVFLENLDAKLDGRIWGPLELAINNGHQEIVSMLLRNGPTPTVTEMSSLFHMARAQGRSDISLILMDFGVGAKYHDWNQMLLEIATSNNWVAIAAEMLKTGAVSDVNDNPNSKQPLLHVSIDKDFFDIARLLLQNGADANRLDQLRRTPLQIATSNNLPDAVSLLLENGADPNIRTDGQQSLLHTAIGRGFVDVAKLLLHGGADSECVDSLGQSPLHIAVISGDIEMVTLLLQKGLDVNLLTGKGLSALYLAVTGRGERSILRALLDSGADPVLIIPHDAARSVRIAVLSGLTELIENFGSLGILEGWYLPHLVSGFGDEVLLKSVLCIDKKCQSSVSTDLRKETPIHVAARAGHLNLAKLLANADNTVLRVPNSSLDTPLHMAARGGYDALVEFLANRNRMALIMLNSKSETPLRVALENSHFNIVHELFRIGDVDNQLKYRNGNLALPNFASAITKCSYTARSLLEIVLSRALYSRDHEPTQEDSACHVNNCIAAVWMLYSGCSTWTLEHEWLSLMIGSLKSRDNVLLGSLVEILPAVKAIARSIHLRLLSCLLRLYDVVGNPSCRSSVCEAVKACMAIGINLFSYTVENGWSLLIRAAFWGDEEMVELGIKSGAPLDGTDGSGRTAYDVAVEQNRRGVQTLLMKASVS